MNDLYNEFSDMPENETDDGGHDMCYERGHEEGFNKGYDEGYDEGVGDILKALKDFIKKWEQSSNDELREKVLEVEDEA